MPQSNFGGEKEYNQPSSSKKKNDYVSRANGEERNNKRKRRLGQVQVSRHSGPHSPALNWLMLVGELARERVAAAAADDAAAAAVGPRGEAWTFSRGRRARWEQATTNIPPEEPLPRTRQILSGTTLSTGKHHTFWMWVDIFVRSVC